MNAAKEAKAANLSVKDGLKKIGTAFLSTREVSSQECVYRSMPELWLRKIFPKTVFVNTNVPDKRVHVAKSQEELDQLDDDSTDIFKSNVIKRYTIRPVLPIINNLCLAEFAAYYYKDYKTDSGETKDCQPYVLTDDILESQSFSELSGRNYPRRIKLLNKNEYMKCRKVKAVLRNHTPNKTKEPEAYFHHLLILYYPWRDENSLLANDGTYMTTFLKPDVQTVVENNRGIFEPDADAISQALEQLRVNDGNLIHSYDAINDQENADLQIEIGNNPLLDECFNEQLPSHLDPTQFDNINNAALTVYNQPTQISNDISRQNIRSLNHQQRCAYDTFLSWCRQKMKNLNTLNPVKIEPLYLFITGGGGTGKSHLIKTIYHTAVKTFRHPPMNPELPTVLLMAPTGMTAINIDGTTINTALAIPKEAGDIVPAMSDQRKTQLRLLLTDLKLIIVDEISMVGNTTLLHIHQRLKEIFGTLSSQLFAGISIIAVGDLCQLPPIRKRFVFDMYKNDSYNLCHPWKCFKMIELTKIMRQKDELAFIAVLHRIRTSSQTEHDITLLQSRSITLSDPYYPSNALHIWAENAPVDEHNRKKIEELPGTLYILKANDQYPPKRRKKDIDRLLQKNRSETGGLDYEILVKEGARIMLTTNISISDCLINGQIGTVFKIDVNNDTQNPNILYIKFDDSNAGTDLINTCNIRFAKENNVVPITPVLARIKIRPGKASSPEMQRVQFPVSLAWACTVHKVQGLTLEKVVLSTHLVKQRQFNHGQIYVALSRVVSFNGLYILGKIENKHVRTSSKALEEYERLRRECLINQPVYQRNLDDLIVTLLNIRSLKKHCCDVKDDSRVFSSDVMAFTETSFYLKKQTRN